MAFSEVDSHQVQAVLGCLLSEVAAELSGWCEAQKDLGAEYLPLDDASYGVQTRGPVFVPAPAQRVAARASAGVGAQAPQPQSADGAQVRGISEKRPHPAMSGGMLTGCLASFNALRGSDKPARLENNAEKAAALEMLRCRTASCRLCRLGGVRRDIMWSTGPCDASVMFVAAGGNPHELESGRIMPGEAGVLLDRIIAAMAKLHPEASPDRIYMTNVIKCASFPNKAEIRDVVKNCLNVLREEIRIISPKVIVVWGPLAYQAMFGGDVQISQVRGTVQKYENIPTIVTHHPLEMIKNGNLKGRTWADVQLAVAQLPRNI